MQHKVFVMLMGAFAVVSVGGCDTHAPTLLMLPNGSAMNNVHLAARYSGSCFAGRLAFDRHQ